MCREVAGTHSGFLCLSYARVNAFLHVTKKDIARTVRKDVHTIKYYDLISINCSTGILNVFPGIPIGVEIYGGA